MVVIIEDNSSIMDLCLSFVFAHPPPPPYTLYTPTSPGLWCVVSNRTSRCFSFFSVFVFRLRNVGGLAVELTSPGATLGQQLRDVGICKAQVLHFLTNLRHNNIQSSAMVKLPEISCLLGFLSCFPRSLTGFFL